MKYTEQNPNPTGDLHFIFSTLLTRKVSMKLPWVTKHYCCCLSEYNAKAEMYLKYGTDCKQQYLCFIFTFFSLWFMGMPKILRRIRGLIVKSYSFRLLSVCYPSQSMKPSNLNCLNEKFGHLLWLCIRYSENLNRVYFKWYEYLTSIKLRKNIIRVFENWSQVSIWIRNLLFWKPTL